MGKYVLSLRSMQRLKGVHPDLIRVVTLGLTYSSLDFGVSEGVRGFHRQQLLVQRGFSKTLNSKHLIQPDGFGHAVDVIAVGDLDGDGRVDAQDKSLTWSPDIYTTIARAVKQAASDLQVPIRWGGEFKFFFDGPHFQIEV